MNYGSETAWERFCTVVKTAMKAKGVPGVAVGILHDGEVSTAAFGVTSVEHPLPVTDETVLQIGSITKTLTGTAIMRLVEAGELDPDATVRSYVPEFAVVDEAASSQATLRHLLTHAGGWAGDHFVDTGAGDDALARYVSTMAGLEQLAPVGTLFSYNNAGFCLAGRVIEVVTDKTYEAALQELVLDPLGLAGCLVEPSRAMTRRFAVGHRLGEDGTCVARPWALPRFAWAAGGIICHVKDLMRYASFHLGDGRAEDGTRVLSPESMKAMQSPQVAIWHDEAWGLSWSVENIGGVNTIGHGGGTVGQISLLTLVPERKFAVAIVTNADAGSQVTREATHWALSQYLGAEIEEPTAIEASEEELAQYEGWYRRPFADIELGILGRRLVGQQIIKQGFPTQDAPLPPMPPPAAFGLCDKDCLLVLDGPDKGTKAHIVRRADGSIGWLRLFRLHRRDP